VVSALGTDEIIATDLEGNAEVVARGVAGMGQSIGWLPDGRMPETGFELMRIESDGSRVRHVDLTHITSYIWGEMTVDGRGNLYVNSIGFDFAEMGRRVQNRAASARGAGTRGRRGARRDRTRHHLLRHRPWWTPTVEPCS
jgi:hypothetical protein